MREGGNVNNDFAGEPRRRPCCQITDEEWGEIVRKGQGMAESGSGEVETGGRDDIHDQSVQSSILPGFYHLLHKSVHQCLLFHLRQSEVFSSSVIITA